MQHEANIKTSFHEMHLKVIPMRATQIGLIRL